MRAHLADCGLFDAFRPDCMLEGVRVQAPLSGFISAGALRRCRRHKGARVQAHLADLSVAGTPRPGRTHEDL